MSRGEMWLRSREIAALVRDFGRQRGGLDLETGLSEERAAGLEATQLLLGKAGNSGRILFALEGSVLKSSCVGFIVCTGDRKERMLDFMNVALESRSQGIGEILLQAAEQDAFQRGATTMTIQVEGFNRRGRKFFERAGYTATGRPQKGLLTLSKSLSFLPDSTALRLDFISLAFPFVAGFIALILLSAHTGLRNSGGNFQSLLIAPLR